MNSGDLLKTDLVQLHWRDRFTPDQGKRFARTYPTCPSIAESSYNLPMAGAGLTATSNDLSGSATINWKGNAVGAYTSGGENSDAEFGANAGDKKYSSYYFVSCSTNGEVKYLACTLNLSRANRETHIAWGSFSGTVAVISGKKKCPGFETDDYKETSISGYFRVPWTVF